MAAFLINTVNIVFWIYMIMLFVKILSSWVPEMRGLPFMQFIHFCTEPYLAFFRRFIPPAGMIDFSPIVAFLCLGLMEHGLRWLIDTLLS